MALEVTSFIFDLDSDLHIYSSYLTWTGHRTPVELLVVWFLLAGVVMNVLSVAENMGPRTVFLLTTPGTVVAI